ncbi:MAG: hypothetical protein JJU36_08095 [Phycisphaeraceae bacterium]|nr:hypothetical protein [Phycisphaeraceae bacterium]
MKRLLIYLGVIALSIWPWLLVEGMLVAPDGSEGLSLTSARAAPILAVLLAIAAAIVPAALAWVIARWHHAVGGLLCFTISLSFLAHRGGGVDGWMHRVSLPAGWISLAIEILVWGMVVLIVGVVIERLIDMEASRKQGGADANHSDDSGLRLLGPIGPMLGAGVVAGVVQLILLGILLASPHLGQAFWSLVIAGLLSGIVVHLAFPKAALLGVALAPIAVGLSGYVQAMINYDNTAAALAAFYQGDLPSRVMALPVLYASAGCAATLLGVVIAPGVISSESKPTRESTAGE